MQVDVANWQWQTARMTDRELTRALAAHDRATQALEEARAQLHSAIADQLRAGAFQAELVKITGYSREHIRRIARDAGITADAARAGTGRADAGHAR